jgi:hypothetical protein
LRPGGVHLLTLTAPGSHRHTYGPGRAWCPCTPAGGIDLARWNGEASRRWNDFVTDLRRRWRLRVSYFRGVELQERGAIHYHVIVRVTGGRMPTLAQLRELAIAHGFGHALKVDALTGGQGRARAAGYVSKYVSKSSTERRRAPYVHRVTGEIGPGRWRTWSASRDWGLTMGALRRSQAVWATAKRAEAEATSPDGARRPGGPLLIPAAAVTHTQLALGP